jgi:hypothetical protein
MRGFLLGVLLLASGCVGSIYVEGDAGAFGAATSGSRVDLQFDDNTLSLFAVSNRPGLCGDLQGAMPAAMDAIDRWGLAILDSGACNTLWEDLDEAWSDVLGNGVNFSFISPVGDNDVEEGTFSVGDEWAVTLAYQEENVYTSLFEGSAGCDVGAEGDLTDSFVADSGSLDVSGSDDSGWRLNFGVALEDEGGADAGDATGSFAMQLCEVELVGTSVLEWGVTSGLSIPWLID